MKKIFMVICWLALVIPGFCQNWFPLEVGNKSLGRYTYSYGGGYYCDFYMIHIEKDTLIDSSRYFYVVNKDYFSSTKYEQLWLRYDSPTRRYI